MKAHHIRTFCYYLLGLAILCVLGGLGIAQDKPADDKEPPTYKGRSFATWARLLTNDIDAETRAEAYRALSAFSRHDPDAYLKPSQQLVRTNLPKETVGEVLEVGYSYPAKEWTPKERIALLVAGLQSDQPAHRSAAVNALSGYFSIPAEEATEELAGTVIAVIQNETDSRVRSNAISALSNIVIASEYEYDTSNSTYRVFKSIRPAGKYGPVLKKALPVIEKLLNDSQESVRTPGLHALSNFPRVIAVEKFADQLLVLAKSGNIVTQLRGRRVITEDERMAKEILALLPKYGSKAKPSLPTLEKIRQDYPDLDPILGRSLRSAIEQIKEAAD